MKSTFELAQRVIDGRYVKCPHCKALVELSCDVGVSVDAPRMTCLTFCSWKCLGRWIAEVYEQGNQFEYHLEVAQEVKGEGGMKYLALATWLPDGQYKTTEKLTRYQRLRLKMALWLFESVPKTATLGITTTTGVSPPLTQEVKGEEE